MAARTPGRIFISYRRQETAWPARQLYDVLSARFGPEQVFKDVDDIEPGDDFVDRITGAVGSCDVLLALIGHLWAQVTDEAGNRRLDDPGDFVRLEITTALDRGIRVIPILVDDAPMPLSAQLPDELKSLVRRQAVRIDPETFDTHRLLDTMAETLAVPTPGAPVSIAPGATAGAEPGGLDVTPEPGELPTGPQSLTPTAASTEPTTPPVSPPPGRVPSRRWPGRGVLAVVGAAVLVSGLILLILLTPRLWSGQGASSGSSTGPAVSPSERPTITTPSTPTPTPSSVGGQLAVLAHRGGWEKHGLETLEAMVAAATDGYSVETDVRYTRDGVAVLVHDEAATKGFACSPAVNVSQVTWARLKRACRSRPVAADSRSYQVPRYDATMEAIASVNPTAWVFPEIKTEQSAAQAKAFLQVLSAYGLHDRAVITSFEQTWLTKIRQFDAKIPTMRFLKASVGAAELERAGLWAVGVPYEIVSKSYLDELHAAGLKVVVYTVNERTEWAKARAAGADTVVTDTPKAYSEWLATQ